MSNRIRDYVYGDTPVQEWCTVASASQKTKVPFQTIHAAIACGRLKSVPIGERLAVELTEVGGCFPS